MKFFEVFPKIQITNLDNSSMIYTNLLARVNIIPSLIQNPALFYTYDYQDSDRPDIIATKYYNNPYRYWIFLFGNSVVDPFWDLPLPENNFQIYLNDKYSTLARANNQTVAEYLSTTVYQYQEVVTSIDSITQNVTINYFNVDYETYANLVSNLSTTSFFPDGSYVTVNRSKRIYTIGQYEFDNNEQKRRVYIIDKKYSIQMEDTLKQLMKQ